MAPEPSETSWQRGGAKKAFRRSRSSSRRSRSSEAPWHQCKAQRSRSRSIDQTESDDEAIASFTASMVSSALDDEQEVFEIENVVVNDDEEIVDEEGADALISDCSDKFVGILLETVVMELHGLDDVLQDAREDNPITVAAPKSTKSAPDYSNEIVSIIVNDVLGIEAIESDESRAYEVSEMDNQDLSRSPSPQELVVMSRSPSPLEDVEDVEEEFNSSDVEDIEEETSRLEVESGDLMSNILHIAMLEVCTKAENEETAAEATTDKRSPRHEEAVENSSSSSSALPVMLELSETSEALGASNSTNQDDVDDGDLSTQAADRDCDIDKCSVGSDESDLPEPCDVEVPGVLDRVFQYACAPTPDPEAESTLEVLRRQISMELSNGDSTLAPVLDSEESLLMSSEIMQSAATEAEAALIAMRNAINDAVDEVYSPEAIVVYSPDEIIQRSQSACAMARQESLAAGVGTRAENAAIVIQRKYRAVVQQRKQPTIELAMAAFESLAKLAMQEAAAAIQRRWKGVRQRPASALARDFPVTAVTKPLEGAPRRKRPGTAPAGAVCALHQDCEEVEACASMVPKAPTSPKGASGRFRRTRPQQQTQDSVELAAPLSPAKPPEPRPGSSSRPRPVETAAATAPSAEIVLNPVSPPVRHTARAIAPQRFTIGKDSGYVPFSTGDDLRCEFEALGKTEIFSVRTPACSPRESLKGQSAMSPVSKTLPPLTPRASAKQSGRLLPDLPTQKGITAAHPLNPVVCTPRKSAGKDLLS